ncbi:hypothetical protein DERP_013294 [Dermatophagoides pteronyssinus]|uniref:Uncharacterized protein n=1 Tax=Dermatophagoides pteronyssinus TaxID=6956 RepID=A0ABQ8J3I9_DERPT|nr:hypothetical protein DERP_013294 [Dermatophagoides pteronyssinus]
MKNYHTQPNRIEPATFAFKSEYQWRQSHPEHGKNGKECSSRFVILHIAMDLSQTTKQSN